LNSKTADDEFLDIAKVVKFVAYSITHPNYTIKEQLKILGKFPIDVVEYVSMGKEMSNALLSDYLIKRREKSPYDIDGLVVIDSGRIYELEDTKPDYGFAFKMILKDQVAETIVTGIEWNASMHGLLKPTALLESVVVANTTIERATAHNAKFVVDNLIGPGSRILLARSNDVIPKIEKVLTPSFNEKPDLPKVPYKWNKTKVDFVVQDVFGEAKDNIKIKKIYHFFKIIEAKYIGEGVVKKLVESGHDDVFKIIKVDVDELALIDGFGDILADKVVTEIDRSLGEAKLEHIIAGSTIFGRGFGLKKSRIIAKEYPDIVEGNYTVDDIMKLEGFSKVLSQQFIGCLDEFKEFYSKLKKTGKLGIASKSDRKIINKSSKLFDGMKIVLTGSRDKEIMDFIESNGGTIVSSVSKKTSLVVYVDPSTSKYLKAIELEVDVVHLDEFVKKWKI